MDGEEMPCGFMKAKKKIREFLKQPKIEPVSSQKMTQPQIDKWVGEMEHAMDETLSDPVERSKVREKMAKIIRLQPKMPGVGYNPNAIRIEKIEEKTIRRKTDE